MKSKKLVALLTTLTFLALTSIVFAADRVEVKVTNEPIHKDAPCDKGGGFSLEWDTGSVITHGDKITIGLDYPVTLCKTIDLIVANNGSAGRVNGTDNFAGVWAEFAAGLGFDNATISQDSTQGAYFSGPTGVGAGPGIQNGEILFRVRGNAGSGTINVDVVGQTTNTFLQVGSTDPSDKFVLTFLDQHTSDIFVDNDPDSPDGVYEAAGTLSDNTLCINVQGYPQNTVNGNMDSQGDIFTFIPPNPTIAYVSSAVNYSYVDCKDTSTEAVQLPTGGQGGAQNCEFNYSTGAGDWCDNAFTGNRFVYLADPSFDVASYQVTMEILVNDTTFDGQGVYFASDEVQIQFDNNNLCEGTLTLANDATAPTVYLASGTAGTVPAGTTNCGLTPAGERLTKIVSGQFQGQVTSGDNYVAITLPKYNFDFTGANAVSSGDVAKTAITLSKIPCGFIFNDTVTVATFGCSQVGNELYYPYFTQLDDDDTVDQYHDGFVVINLSDDQGSFDMTVYEKDGDVGTLTGVVVEGRSMYVNMLVLVYETLTQTVVSPTDGTLGNSACYIHVNANFKCDGFGFMWVDANGSSIGYLPRNEIVDDKDTYFQN